MSRYDVSLEVTLTEPAIDVAALHHLAERVMTEEAIAEGTALAILVTDDDEVRAMNRQFLGIDEPTDVLSFPDESDDFVQGMADQELLGDIAIALPLASRQAAAIGHPLDAEVAHLLVHGILHLCGYDHVTSAEDEARMRSREEHYLGDLGAVHQH
jgi:probable rRNA maturation factor